MGKRPLALGCLFIILLLYLATLLSPMTFEDLSEYDGEEVLVAGKVFKKEKVRQFDGQTLVIYLEDLSDVCPPGKKIMCYLKTGQEEPEIGSKVTLTGKVRTFERASNPGQFDAYSYYQISGISYRLNQAIILEKSIEYCYLEEGLYRMRCFFTGILAENLPEKESALIQTMLLGEKSDLDKDLKALYQRNGIAHILAISGLHVSMLGMGIYRILRKCGIYMRTSAILATSVMILYGIMTGFSVSAVRAILMFALHMLAVLVKRTYDMLTAVAVAAVLILIEQPFYFYHSGFVFSFGCVVGIGLVVPALTEERKALGEERTVPVSPAQKSSLTGKWRIKGFLTGKWTIRSCLLKKWKIESGLWRGIQKAFLSPLAIAAVTFPIYLWFYYQFPPYSILLNLLVIPLMSYLMVAGLLVILFGVLCKPIIPPFVFLISGVFRVYETACEVCERFPAYLLNLGKPEDWQMVIYLFMLLLIMFLRKKAKLIFRWLLVLVAIGILIVRPKEKLEITFLDVGQGDSIYIESVEGSRFLIDGGSSSVSSVGEYRMIPFLKHQGVRKLDAVFVTHPDEDHCNGILELLEIGEQHGISVGCLVLPDIKEKSRNEAYQDLEQTAVRAGVAVLYISTGQEIRKGELVITCLHPQKGYETQDANAYSIVLDVWYEEFSALLTGDLEGEEEETVFDSERQISSYTILKVAHHGSRYSTGEEFLEQTRPKLAVISCGERNSYGHPHEETLKRLEAVGCEVLTTPECGAITVEVGEDEVKVYGFVR